MANLIDIIMPKSDEGTESFLESWFKKPGDYVEEHEPLLEINTDKVTMEVSAPASGILKEILKEPNEPIETGEVLGRIEAAEKTESAAADEPDEPRERRRERRRATDDSGSAGLSPAVRRLFKKHDLDASQFSGTGRGGRITAEDVEAFLESESGSSEKTAAASSGIPGKMVPHKPLRLRTANHMVESLLKTAPHVTAVFDADLSAVIAHRQNQKAEFEKKGGKLTFTSYFVDAAVKALQAVPEVNSRWHDTSLEIFDDANIGIAAATDAGLVVPVIQQSQHLDLLGIAEKLQTLTNRARDGKLEKTDIQNGTFTITNHGMTGSLIATPIINQPQSAILGIGKLEKRVIVVEKDGKDTTEIKPMAYITLTIDHRALDGFQANTFLTAFVNALQNW